MSKYSKCTDTYEKIDEAALRDLLLFLLYRKVRLWLLSESKIAHKKWARQINDHGN